MNVIEYSNDVRDMFPNLPKYAINTGEKIIWIKCSPTTKAIRSCESLLEVKTIAREVGADRFRLQPTTIKTDYSGDYIAFLNVEIVYVESP